MISKSGFEKLVFASDLGPAEKLVALAYASHGNWETGKGIRPSQTTIAHETGYSLRTVNKVTAQLVTDAYLVHTHFFKDGIKVYRLSAPDVQLTTMDTQSVQTDVRSVHVDAQQVRIEPYRNLTAKNILKNLIQSDLDSLGLGAEGDKTGSSSTPIGESVDVEFLAPPLVPTPAAKTAAGKNYSLLDSNTPGIKYIKPKYSSVSNIPTSVHNSSPLLSSVPTREEYDLNRVIDTAYLTINEPSLMEEHIEEETHSVINEEEVDALDAAIDFYGYSGERKEEMQMRARVHYEGGRSAFNSVIRASQEIKQEGSKV